jgi:hypothetical protein
MVYITNHEREYGGGFGIYHLFISGRNLSPGGSFLEGGAGTSAVADIGHGNLNGIFMHLGLES